LAEDATDRIPGTVIAVLMGLTALGAVAIDITLVALPAMAAALGGEPARSGLIITAFLAGFAPGQLSWGYVAERYGRRPAVIAGLALYVVATAACALAPTFSWLLAARFLQGFTSGVGPVTARAITRDFATEIAGARLMSLLTAVVGTVPLLAPLVGAALLEHTDWRGIFWLTGAIGTVWFLIATARLPETRPADAPRFDFGTVAQDTRDVVGTRDFRVGASLVALPFAGYHSILALYPGVVIVDFGVSASRFAWLFAIAAACFTTGSTLSRALVARTGLRPLMVAGAIVCLAGAALSVIGVTRPALAWLAACTALYVLGVGALLPLGMTVALRRAAGSAAWTAAVLGLVQISGGVLCSYIATLTGHVPVSLAVILLTCGLLSFAVIATQRVDRPPCRFTRAQIPAPQRGCDDRQP
jgi:DHA1 family bicyclomycin/chloramphenicol resistance-like MFS transporter